MRFLLAVLGILAAVRATAEERILMGVDYYPEHWPLDDMVEDIRSIRKNLGADIVRVGDFMWSILEPEDGVFNFTLLDAIVDAAENEGLQVMLATPTAGIPAWLYTSKPNVLQRGPDSPSGYAGSTPGFGGRRLYSFNSQTFSAYAARIVTKLEARYRNRSSITHFQVDNELGHEGSDLDFSDAALDAWREWLRKTYERVENLNNAWGTVFWSATYSSFEQIGLPRWTTPGVPVARPNENFRSNVSPGMLLDYRRFRSESIADFARLQTKILHKASTKLVTTNSPGGVWQKAMDSNAVFDSMDLVAYDNYPVWGGSLAPTAPSDVALQLDIVRGWGKFDSRVKSGTGARGWMVAEQLIGAQGHDIIGYTPRPGQIVAWSVQTLAHGATSLLFFRYRAARFGQEEFCYGVLDQTTRRGTGRKFIEAKEVFAIARGPWQHLWLSPVIARVAVVYDPDNIFAWQSQPQSTAFDFMSEAARLYYPFYKHGVAIDVLSTKRLERGDIDISQYRVLLMPVPMLLTDATFAIVDTFVESGGSLWTSFRGDVKTSTNQMRSSESRLAALAGVSVEEFESLLVGTSPVQLQSVEDDTETAQASVWRDGLRIVDDASPKAEPLWSYTDDAFFGGLGLSAVTVRHIGKTASVVYVGTGIAREKLVSLASSTLDRQGINPIRPGMRSAGDVSDDVERLFRTDSEGQLHQILINYGSDSVRVGGISLSPYGVSVSVVR